MKRIMLINPNTTASMTAAMADSARTVAAPGTDIVAVNPVSGPASIETHYDEVICSTALMEEVCRGEVEGMDAFIIACFGDPGLLAAREVATGPVLGIAEAAMHVATFIATRFSIVTTLSRTKIMSKHLVRAYGMEQFCAGIHACDVSVSDLENKPDYAFDQIAQYAVNAVKEDEAGAIILGCGGMTDLRLRIQDEAKVPVVDGVVAAVKLAEALIGLGLETSKQGDLDYPFAKQYSGLFKHFSPK